MTRPIPDLRAAARHAATAALLITAFVLTGCASTPLPSAPTDSGAVVVKKSPNDAKAYRYVVLPNALRVLLVSDPGTDVAAASLTVLRGYYDEPEAYPGLAHFLEHMLFIGTEKYPDVDGYQQFVSKHGGQSNAYTSAEHTNYFFEIQPDQFRPAMDRFAQFFISPLLDAEYVEREKNAVNSEYQMQIRDDGWRANSVVRVAMNPDYEGSRFYIGSLDTLGDGVAWALQTFFDENYSADQMVLVALGNESLDDMESWIRPLFGAIENKDLGPSPEPAPAFVSGQLPARLTYASLSDSYTLSYNFPIPAVDAHYQVKPAQYLTNLLGHEGEGSLHQVLKSRGWIESLAAGVSRLDSANALLTVTIELTPGGRQATDAITELLYGYIALLNAEDPEAWRYDEQATVAELSFRFQEQTSPTGFVYRTSPNLGLYPPEDVLIADYLMEGFDERLIRHYLSYLRPDNVLVELSGPDVETDNVEAWFNVPYRLERPISATQDTQLAGMHLPEPNPFLPEDVRLVSNVTAPPALAVDEPGVNLWLAPDEEFRVPRANQTFTLGLEGGLATARDVALASIYGQLVTDALNPYAYPAMLAGLSYQIDSTAAGLRVSVAGFSDRQSVLLERVLDELMGLKIDPARFEQTRDELVREWQNFRFERPYIQAYAALSDTLLDTSFAPDVLAAAAIDLEAADVARWGKDRLDRISVVGLSNGNLNGASVRDVSVLLERKLPLAGFELRKPELTPIESPLLLELDVTHDDAAMVLYVQDAEASYESRARSALAAQILQQSYFSSLRTDQQLGYVVSMMNRTLRDRGALVFAIQSPVASPAALERATLEFMATQLPLVAAMDAESFEHHKAGLISRLTEQPKNLRERTMRYLADLDADVTTFDSQEQIARIVGQLGLDDVVAYLEETAARLTDARLLVYTLGKFDEAPANGRHLTRSAAGI
ncbi:MAG: insulinase family protein [Pseudomonadales bacterium]